MQGSNKWSSGRTKRIQQTGIDIRNRELILTAIRQPQEPTDISHIELKERKCRCGCGKTFKTTDPKADSFANRFCLSMKIGDCAFSESNGSFASKFKRRKLAILGEEDPV